MRKLIIVIAAIGLLTVVHLILRPTAPSGAAQGASPPDSFHARADWKKHPTRVLDIVLERLFARAEAGGAD